jgi:hypothetical protein
LGAALLSWSTDTIKLLGGRTAVANKSDRVDLFTGETKTVGRGTRFIRLVVRSIRRKVIFPGDTRATSLKRLLVITVGWGAVLGLFIWSGYHQGRLHGVGDGIILGAILTAVAMLLGWKLIRPPGPNDRRDTY